MMVSLRESLTFTLRDDGTRRPTGIKVSLRRLGKLQAALQANAWLAGRDHVSIEDFTALEFGLWDKRQDVEVVRSAIHSLDAVAMKAVTDAIDAGMKAIRDFTNGAQGNARLASSLKTAAGHARAAGGMFKEPVFTDASRRKIGTLLKEFKTAYADVSTPAKAAAK